MLAASNETYRRLFGHKLPDAQTTAAVRLWLDDQFDPIAALYWFELLTRRDVTAVKLLSSIARWDAVPFIHLLYPRFPQLFTTPRSYRLDAGDQVRHATLCAASLFALCGAKDCLGSLLELGADPDGTEEDWDYLEKRPDREEHNRLLTPLDCAALAGEEACRDLLLSYHAQGLYDHCGGEPSEEDQELMYFLTRWGVHSRSCP